MKNGARASRPTEVDAHLQGMSPVIHTAMHHAPCLRHLPLVSSPRMRGAQGCILLVSRLCNCLWGRGALLSAAEHCSHRVAWVKVDLGLMIAGNKHGWPHTLCSFLSQAGYVAIMTANLTPHARSTRGSAVALIGSSLKGHLPKGSTRACIYMPPCRGAT